MTGILDLQAREHRSGVLDRWLAQRPGAFERAAVRPSAWIGGDAPPGSLSADDLVKLISGANLTAAGQAVTPDNALRVSAVYACVSLISGALATMPVGVFERKDDERSRVQHAYSWWLNEEANDDMTSAAAWEYVTAAKLFYGDGFAELLRPSYVSTRVIGMRPHHPLDVHAFRDNQGIKRYRVYDQAAKGWRDVDAADMIQVPSLGYDGLRSPSPITYAARESIGMALGAEGYMAKFFSGGATFDYALKTASTLKSEQLQQLYDSLMRRESIAGPRAPLILTGGLEPAQLSVNQKDAEVLATRLFTVEEICRIFGVPPHMVGHTDKTTSWGSGIEQQGIAFVRYTLQRHLTPLAQELNRKLWPSRERYFVEHITAALERGDLKSRYESYRIALGRAGEQPWMDTDEIRRIENMPPNQGLRPNEPGGPNAPQ